MLAVGSMSKGKFVEGSKIKIYYVPNADQYQVKKSHDVIYLKYKKVKCPLSKFKVFADCIYYKENGEERFKGLLDLLHMTCYGTFRIYNNPHTKSLACSSKDAIGAFCYFPLSVDAANARVGSWGISATKTKDGYFMRAQNKNSGYDAKDTMPVAVEGILPKEDFDVKVLDSSLIFLLNKLERAKIILKNNDEFDGTVKIKAGNYGTLNCELLNGTYKYHSTGDVFVGDYQKIHLEDRIHIPTRGTMKFANGDSITGDWLAGYNFDYDEWEQIYDESKGPTDIRNKAIALKQQKDEEAAKEQAAKEESERQKEARRQYLISKYGNTYGEMLANSKVCIGMTKEMVNEVWPQGYFVVSQVVFSGKKAEQWVFSEDKFALHCAQTGDKGSMVAYMLVKQLGMPIPVPEEMLFVDGILQGLSQ